MTTSSKMTTASIPNQLDSLWQSLLGEYPDGVSNTSTTKYNDIRALLAAVLGVPEQEIYPTGAKTRTSNLDTRFVQGNQAGRHTKVGVAFMQVESPDVDLEKLSDSAVVTSRKFVDGSDKTQYDSILIFVESGKGLLLTRVIQPAAGGYHDLLKAHFPGATLIQVGNALTSPTAGLHTSDPAELGKGTFPALVATFVTDAKGVHLVFQPQVVSRLAGSLLAKRFLILTGLAGSGKTKLAQAFARWITTPEQAKCYELIPVGADWTGSENVLGYPNGLDYGNYVIKPALEVVLHATNHPDIPHFLILDEMNLAHVERYFADILSVIESDEGFELYPGEMDKPETWRKTAKNKPVPPRVIKLPENLFIIGTVNVDETTYMFSPKVLDRANVIEFRMEASELKSFLDNPAKPDLSKLDGKGASFGKAFVDTARNPVDVPANVKKGYEAEMLLFFKALQAHGAEFGYRTAHEAARFVHFHKLLGNYPNGDMSWFSVAFDCVVFQKLLPKLHGSRSKLGPLLKNLWFLCVKNEAARGIEPLKAAEAAVRSTDKEAEPSTEVPAGAPYPLSAEKIGRMWRLLNENGFASFAEA